jgi:hypothetical protein
MKPLENRAHPEIPIGTKLRKVDDLGMADPGKDTIEAGDICVVVKHDSWNGAYPGVRVRNLRNGHERFLYWHRFSLLRNEER